MKDKAERADFVGDKSQLGDVLKACGWGRDVRKICVVFEKLFRSEAGYTSYKDCLLSPIPMLPDVLVHTFIHSTIHIVIPSLLQVVWFLKLLKTEVKLL